MRGRDESSLWYHVCCFLTSCIILLSASGLCIEDSYQFAFAILAGLASFLYRGWRCVVRSTKDEDAYKTPLFRADFTLATLSLFLSILLDVPKETRSTSIVLFLIFACAWFSYSIEDCAMAERLHVVGHVCACLYFTYRLVGRKLDRKKRFVATYV